MHLETEALLMFAARREHVAQVIEPALARGEWVVCDRFVDASFAYQGGGRGLDWEKLEHCANGCSANLQPDLTLIFDAPVEIAQKRLHAATANPDRFEQEQAAFFERVRAAYLRIASENPQRVRLIDATQTPRTYNKVLEVIVAAYLNTFIMELLVREQLLGQGLATAARHASSRAARRREGSLFSKG
jgi:dTMP kinase